MKLFFCLGLAALLLGCREDDAHREPPVAEPPRHRAEHSPEAAPMIEAVKKDLARRLGVAVDTIALAQVEEMTWPDASLGCPRPDRFYAQVVTPGYRIQLRADGREYSYHTDRRRSFVLCEDAERGVPDGQ